MKNYLKYLIILFIGIAIGAVVLSLAQDNPETLITTDDQKSTESWTCSMHPQIMQPEPGDCPICGMDLIPAASSTAGLSADEIKMTANAVALANIQTTIVGSDARSNSSLQLSGKIKINEDQTATLPAHFDGRVEKLYVTTLGEKVTKGQLIATVYAPALVAAQQELITTARLKNTQPQLHQAVRNKFKNWKIHSDILDQILESGQIITNFPIYSHVNGTVTTIAVNEGSHIMDGAPILKVSDLNSVWVELDVYENQISALSVGQQLVITSSAYPGTTVNARISFIDPLLNANTRTATVRAIIDNKNGIWKPEMFVTAQVAVDSTIKDNDIIIPSSAVIWTGKRSLVYLKTDPSAPVFEMREVVLGTRNNDKYIIVSGLIQGDEIVTQGAFTVDAAAQLQGKKSMMNFGSSFKKELPSAIQQVLKCSVIPYLGMKNAFVSSNAMEVSAFAKATLTTMQVFPEKDLGNDLKSPWSRCESLLSKIAASSDLEKQRLYFIDFNTTFIELMHQVSALEQVLYVQQCPMVSNNKGAIWLSADAAVKNPYYGDAMLTCGSVIEELE